MIQNIQIIDELNRKLLHLLPSFKFYINKVEDDFTRPSCFIEFITQTSERINLHTTDNKVHINVTAFCTFDEYGDIDNAEQQQTLSVIRKEFVKGELVVDDRVIGVSFFPSKTDAELLVQFTFNYFDDIGLNKSVYKTVKEIQIKQKLGGDNE